MVKRVTAFMTGQPSPIRPDGSENIPPVSHLRGTVSFEAPSTARFANFPPTNAQKQTPFSLDGLPTEIGLTTAEMQSINNTRDLSDLENLFDKPESPFDQMCSTTVIAPPAVSRVLSFPEEEPPAKKRKRSSKTVAPIFLRDVEVTKCTTVNDRIQVEIDELQERYLHQQSLSHQDRTRLGMALITYLSNVLKLSEKQVRTIKY